MSNPEMRPPLLIKTLRWSKANHNVFPHSSILSIANWLEKRRPLTNPSPTLGGRRGVRGLLGEGRAGGGGKEKKEEEEGVKGLSRPQFDISIGQDMVEKENSLRSQEERKRDILEHSYSSLSDYHSNRQ